MTAHEHPTPPSTIEPDPAIATEFLNRRLMSTTQELAETFSAVQVLHRQLTAAKQRIGELEHLLVVVQQPDSEPDI